MRVEVDTGRCCGAGMCALTAPAVFDQDEDAGTVLLLTPEPSASEFAAVREAAQLCPAGAITLEDKQ
ncbi:MULTISPECIES: ferredoxin [unclassified Crossiella]|uniref:ferredoxin n=1 Tax=unclassified Crossiella TaxID=2620835 RepID=UPI001FFECB9B|nr:MULTISPECIES: ferredoxin [unclassified Crossiella]MCK2239889.1 ferredoxin [Crossiella sp. S99.2]MCK2252597.1 ferredoxin [Crossiella sp. S99.1]